MTAKSIENVIANDSDLSGMELKPADMLDLSFLERLEEEVERRGDRKFLQAVNILAASGRNAIEHGWDQVFIFDVRELNAVSEEERKSKVKT